MSGRMDLTFAVKQALKVVLLETLDTIVTTQRRTWIRKFVYQQWPGTRNDAKTFDRKRQIVYRLLEMNKKQQNPTTTPTRRGSGVRPSLRKRAGGAGNRVLGAELGVELFQWFVDTINTTHARIWNDTLLLMAKRLRDDLDRIYDTLLEEGQLQSKPKLPTIGTTWLARWRKEYHVSWRTVTIVYKVPRSILNLRLGIFWRNCIRLRYFHSKMFPHGRLRFRSYDQKPLYFNTSGEGKTCALGGSKDVEVRENCHATRLRFTVMTKSVDKTEGESMEDVRRRSSGSGNPERLAVLFKNASGGARVRSKFTVPADTLLQFGPKGSYRTDTVLEFLNWDLGDADEPKDGSTAEIVCLDWFAAHLDGKVQNLVTDKGHVPLYIPGGATPWVATLDTHYHAPYQHEYKAAERTDAERQLRGGRALPECTPQVVMDRAVETWKIIPHEKLAERSWVETGITLPLDGRGDQYLRRLCRPFWDELDMPGHREQIKTEIDMAIASGQLASWDQWPELMEPYDNHPGMAEGMEGARCRIGDPDDCDDDHSTDDDDDSPGDDGAGGGDPHAAAIENAFESAAANAEGYDAPDVAAGCGEGGSSGSGGGSSSSGGSGSSGSSGSTSGAAPVSVADALATVPTPPCSLEAELATVPTPPCSLEAELEQLAEVRRMAERLGNARLLRVVEEQIVMARKRLAATVSPVAGRLLREEAVARRQRDADERSITREERNKRQLLQAQEAKAKAELALARVKGHTSAQVVKAKLQQLQAEKEKAKQQKEEDAKLELRIRLHFASILARRCLEFTVWGEKATGSQKRDKQHELKARVAALKTRVAKQAARKTGDAQLTLPTFMEPSRP
jgi:hypothetical protein